MYPFKRYNELTTEEKGLAHLAIFFLALAGLFHLLSGFEPKLEAATPAEARSAVSADARFGAR